MLVIDAAGSSTSELRLDSGALALQPDKKGSSRLNGWPDFINALASLTGLQILQGNGLTRQAEMHLKGANEGCTVSLTSLVALENSQHL